MHPQRDVGFDDRKTIGLALSYVIVAMTAGSTSFEAETVAFGIGKRGALVPPWIAKELFADHDRHFCPAP